GTRWGVREAGLVLLLLATVGYRRTQTRRRTAVPVVAGATLAAVGAALLGHAGTGRQVDLLRVLATAVHLVAALTWAGAVLCLAIVIVGSRVSRRLPALPLRVAVRGFAAPAGCCVGVAVVTGVYLASHVVVSLDAAVTTVYGRMLLLKLALVGAAGALALANHRRVRRSDDFRLPRRTVAAEAAVAVLVVLATAVLTNGQPATEPQLVDAGPRPTSGPLSGQVQDLQESVDVRPNRPGPAVLLVDAFDTRRPAPEPVTAVTVRLGDGREVAAVPLGEGHWSAPVQDLAAGRNPMQVRVTRGASRTVTAGYTWTTGPAGSRPTAVLSRAPMSTLLTGLSALLAGALPLGCWLRRPRRRRLERHHAPGLRPSRKEVEAASARGAGDQSVGVS
ncbi:MAG: copper transport protein, partial [Nocardioidaceae bacterium]|nr:copper transport protein [Nocardioidaceae bacterium]